MIDEELIDKIPMKRKMDTVKEFFGEIQEEIERREKKHTSEKIKTTKEGK